MPQQKEVIIVLEKQIEPNWGWRAEVGLLTPVPWDFREYNIMAPPGVKFSKCTLGLTEATPENLSKIHKAIELEAQKLNIGFKKDLICYVCTSSSFIEGPGSEHKIVEKIEKASGSPATTVINCLLELFKDVGIKKIALTGPYIDSILNDEVEFLKAYDIETVFVKGLGLSKMSDLWNYYTNPYICYRLVKDIAIAAPDADCIFASCGLSNLLGLADTLESEIGKPVVTSVSATMYGILKKLRIPDPVPDYGQILIRPRLS